MDQFVVTESLAQCSVHNVMVKCMVMPMSKRSINGTIYFLPKHLKLVFSSIGYRQTSKQDPYNSNEPQCYKKF